MRSAGLQRKRGGKGISGANGGYADASSHAGFMGTILIKSHVSFRPSTTAIYARANGVPMKRGRTPLFEEFVVLCTMVSSTRQYEFFRSVNSSICTARSGVAPHSRQGLPPLTGAIQAHVHVDSGLLVDAQGHRGTHVCACAPPRPPRCPPVPRVESDTLRSCQGSLQHMPAHDLQCGFLLACFLLLEVANGLEDS